MVIIGISGVAMGKHTSISLGNHFNEFVERQLEHGRYGSASEVVRAGLRLLEEHEVKLNALRAALVEGEQSGPATAFDFDKFLAEKRKRLAG
jgi:antitoxin ParD1/3/4